jgi:hypothetical protein
MTEPRAPAVPLVTNRHQRALGLPLVTNRHQRAAAAVAIVAALAAPSLPAPAQPAGGAAQAAPLESERDALIARITRGDDVEGAARRFAALLRQRDQIVATSHAAKQAEADAKKALRDWREQYEKSVDYDLGWRCTLSVDPRRPVPSDEGRFRADWGRVVRKEAVRLAPKNPLDEGEPATLYEIAGQARHYLIRGEGFGHGRHEAFVADVGELALVCDGDGTRHHDPEELLHPNVGDPDARLPPSWRGLVRHGFAARIKAPPRIVNKGRWNPIHITATNYFWAIHDVRWKYPAGAFVLSNLPLGREIDHRWEIMVERDQSFLVEVPPSLARRSALVAGHRAWLILGQPRFDAALHKLVLVAEDIEATYVDEE